MGAQGLSRLAATRLSGVCATANANASSQIRRHVASRRLHSQAGDTARGLRTSLLGSTATSTARRLSSSANESGQPRRSAKRLVPRWAYYLGLGLVFFAAVTYYNDNDRTSRRLLNRERFTPCLVVSSEPVSPTAFILTVKTPSSRGILSNDAPTNQTVVREAWRHGLWSVEIKQPQLQIARHYTPLPPMPPAVPGDNDDDDAAQLRFLVRRYDGGETSTYLSRLRPGDAVELRGPHPGFDVARRLGPAGRGVVFLAGGTGVAPALQAAARLLDGERDVSVRILWASRAAADCAGCARARAAPPRRRPAWLGGRAGAAGPAVEEEPPGAVVRQLRALQAAYRARGRTLEVRCAVDEEGGAFQAQDIMDAVGRSERLHGQESSSCHFHCQRQLAYSTDEHDAPKPGQGGDNVSSERRCTCVGEGGGGKNLFMLSGPDGFVSAYVGPKVWADGAERQGPVGGLVAELMRKDPATWRDWLVLKQ